jgi:hypothetical protein
LDSLPPIVLDRPQLRQPIAPFSKEIWISTALETKPLFEILERQWFDRHCGCHLGLHFSSFSLFPAL